MPVTVAEREIARDRVSLELQRDIEQFLFEEADLLDNWQFSDWLSLMADDIFYWAPVRENRTHREAKFEMYPVGTSAHFEENKRFLEERVERLLSHMAWAEEPPSRTRHLVTNIRAWETDTPGEYAVESSFYVFRTRGERDMDNIVGRRYDVIRKTDTEYGFQVVRRKIVFDMAMLLVKNLSLFY